MPEKVAYVCSVECPACHETIDILKKTTIRKPAEPAEKEESFMARGSGFEQKKLDGYKAPAAKK